jgi:hypothetical protein
VYRIDWIDAKGDTRNIKVHTARAAADVCNGLKLDYRNADIRLTNVGTRRLREIVIVVK